MIKLMRSSFYREADTKRSLVEFIQLADQLSMGEACRAFERQFATFHQKKFAVFVSSGSMANLLLIQAMKNLGHWKTGDKIGFSTLTWPTNVMPLIQLGLVPVPIDCELETLNVSPRTLTERLDDLRGCFLTHVLGFSDQIDQIAKICHEKNIPLLEDTCEALGSKLQGKLLGTFGLASTFSFFVGHHLSTIEGGMICTDDPALYDMLVMVRAHGWDRNLSADHQAALRQQYQVNDFYAKYTFYDLAYNARPTEIQGHLGTTQIAYLPEIVEKRQQNFRRFLNIEKKNPAVIAQRVDHMETVSCFAIPIVLKDADDFQAMTKRFTDHGVEIRPVIAGDMTQQPFYQKYFDVSSPTSHSDLIHRQGFYFSNDPEMTESEIKLLEQLIQG